jgi:hypothetical protein
MRKSCLSLFLGLTATATVLTPINVQAATFDYSKIKNLPLTPIDSNYVLDFFGDISQNEGYTLVNNLDPNAPDAGHESTALNALPGGAGYYTMGRDLSPYSTGATRSTTLQNITGFPNLSNYLKSNNIPLSSIGYSYGQKNGLDFTKALNLGEDKFGQDWFASPDSPIEERIYKANPDDVEDYLLFGTTKVINLGYSDFYFAADNGATRGVNDNFNVFWSNQVPAFKAAGLDPLASGLADALLADLAATGGGIQVVSEDPSIRAEFNTLNDQYDVTFVDFPLQLRAVSSRNVPEPMSVLGLLMFGALGAVTHVAKLRSSHKKMS